MSDTREAGLKRLEDAKGILEQALWSLDSHIQSAKTGSEDEIRALLDTAERELGLAHETLKKRTADG